MNRRCTSKVCTYCEKACLTNKKETTEVKTTFKVYSGEPNGAQEVYFKLRDDSSGITLCLVDSYGKPLTAGNVLRINKETGKLRLLGGMFNTYGLDLDSKGRINMESEYI